MTSLPTSSTSTGKHVRIALLYCIVLYRIVGCFTLVLDDFIYINRLAGAHNNAEPVVAIADFTFRKEVITPLVNIIVTSKVTLSPDMDMIRCSEILVLQ